jgi:hypothetical protein
LLVSLAFHNDPSKDPTFSTALLTLIISFSGLVPVLHLSKFVQLSPPSAYFDRSSETSVNTSDYKAPRHSQWPRGLRHELSSSAQTLGSWVRIPMEAWMSVCVYSVCAVLCVQVASLQWADPRPKESYRMCKISRN